ncbi:MAG: relaxase [Pedobacter sp.]|nr:MAG: relaxase [Pedobacter sp.]
MVARIVSGKSIRGMLSYNESKVVQGEAKLILASGFATDIDRLNFHQKLYRFEQLTRLNSRVKTNAMHISLNFHIKDQMDPAKLQQIAAEYMDKIGLGDQPFIVYQHLDSSHPHLHIATTLIQKDGKRIMTNGIGKTLSEPARKQLEEKYNLIKAEGRQLKSEPYLRPAEYGSKSTKQQIGNITKAVMQDYLYTSFEQYKAVLAQFNVHVERGAEGTVMFEKKGLLYSITDQKGNPVGVPFKASAFYEGATMKNLEKRFKKNLEKREGKKEHLVRSVEKVFNHYEDLTRKTFQNELAKQQIAILFWQNEQGRVYGLTFIDHFNQTVFNGSELGRGYGAKTLMEWLSTTDVAKVYLQKERIGGWEKEAEVPTHRKKEDSLLNGLLEKADYDPLCEVAKKKRRKKGTRQNLGL